MSLTSPLYKDAVDARVQGDETRARILEAAQFGARHHTPADFMCRGLAKLRHGDWSGWLDYERRMEEPSYRDQFGKLGVMQAHDPWQRFSCDAYGQWAERVGWEAELRDLTILVAFEGGAGDGIMLSRFLPWLVARAKKVYWLVPVDFQRLADKTYGKHWTPERGWHRGCNACVEVIAGETLPAFDRYVMMFSLPAIVGEMLPPDDAYTSRMRVHAPIDAPGGATGLCWSGNEKFHHNAVRSMDARWAARFHLMMGLAIGGDRLSYQRGPAASAWPLEWGDYERVTGDWYETYQSLATECARIVTVDTGLAHLAGAMDIPTYCLVAYDACWRWGTGTPHGRSIWYPAMRLIRQQRPGDWRYPIEEVARLLKAETA